MNIRKDILFVQKKTSVSVIFVKVIYLYIYIYNYIIDIVYVDQFLSNKSCSNVSL